MTLSEKICQDINRKFYFDDFVLTNLYYMKDGIKMEICDGLIEFEDIYIVIQIKERQGTADKNEKWLEKRVYKKAVSQIKDTIKVLHEQPNLEVQDMYSQSVEIDNTKQILPVIIFRNENISDYTKVYHSNTQDININVFSEQDYEKMMTILEMPIDIVDYLKTREELFNKGNFNFIIDDSEDCWLSMARIENEEDIANYFLAKQIKDNSYNDGAVKDFLGIIQKYYSRRTNNNKEYKQILNRMLRFDRFGAELFMERWITSWENAKNGIFNFLCHIVGENKFEKFGFLFISTKKGIKEDSEKFYKYITNLFMQQYHLDTAITIISYYEGNGNYFVNWLMMSKPFKEDIEIQKFLKENNPWKYVLK